MLVHMFQTGGLRILCCHLHIQWMFRSQNIVVIRVCSFSASLSHRIERHLSTYLQHVPKCTRWLDIYSQALANQCVHVHIELVVPLSFCFLGLNYLGPTIHTYKIVHSHKIESALLLCRDLAFCSMTKPFRTFWDVSQGLKCVIFKV